MHQGQISPASDGVRTRSSDLETDRLPRYGSELPIGPAKVCVKQGVQEGFSMAASEIANVSRAIIQIATTIQDLGNNWYKASAEWDDFPRKIASLKRKHGFWTKEFMKSAMLSDPSLMETLGEAEILLEQEKAKLEGRDARCRAGCYFKVSRTMFPAKVGLRIQLVIDAFDAIPGFLRQEEEAAVALGKRMMRKAPSLPFRDDDRYVPLKFTESKVQEALEDPNGSPLVLLHGGPGKGKSTLARHVALQYHGKCNSPEENPDRAFELVAFLECGPKADIRARQLELANLISPNVGATAVAEGQERTDPEDAIWRRLKGLLKHQRILIVFDDVWEQEFLQKMLDLCGVGVKCLVTAQDRDLCRDLSLRHPAIPIQIEDIEDDVAMQILATHVGFTNKQIPEHIQGLAHKVIEGMERHPLALASVAKEIDPDRSDELEEWEAASESFLTALQSRVTKHTFGVAYPQSFWLTMQRSIDAVTEVTEDAPSLLILLHMCEAPSVPEEVLKILFLSAVCEGGSDQFKRSKFKIAMKALRRRGLVNVSSPSQSSYSWSAHSLQKLFMEHEMNDQKETLLKVRKETILKMLGSESDESNIEAGVETKSTTDLSVEEDRMVRISLCELYFHKQYAEKTPLKTEILPNQLRSLRRSAIEPVTRLLALPVSGRWSKSAQSSARQIYLSYIYKSALHDSGIVHLLALSISVLPMLEALGDIAAVESETALIGENSGPLLKALLDLLGNLSNAGHTKIATAAARVFEELSFNQLHHRLIISSGILDTIVTILSPGSNPRVLFACTIILVRLTYYDALRESDEMMQHPAILEQHVQSISSDNIPDLQGAAGAALMNLSQPDNEITAQQLVNFPGLLEQLVNVLSKDNRPDLRRNAAICFKNLAGPSEYRVEKIITCPGAIQKLLASMSMNDSPELQQSAAGALVNLTRSQKDSTVQRLVDFPRLLEQLVNVLSKDNSPDLQTEGARCLVNLGRTQYGKETIVAFPGVIQQLLASMSRNDSLQLQLQAAGALVNLAASDNDFTEQRLVEFPGLLEQLVNVLSKDNSPDLQIEVASCLRNLGRTQYGKETIVAFPGVIQQLLASMSRNDSLQLQLEAAAALVNLAASDNDFTVQRLVDFPGLLEQLVNVLSKDNSPDLQTEGARCLANLGRTQYGKETIVAFPGVIQQLLACMSRNDSLELQLKEAKVLVNLASSDNDFTVQRLVEFPRLLEQLVDVLSKDNSPDLQTQVARCLVNLARTQYGKDTIVAFPGVIQQLLACMSRNDSLELQLKAAKVLVNLASSDNDFTVQRLVEFPRLLEQLVNVLSNDNSPDFQTRVASCFGNLARTQYGKDTIVAFPGVIQQLLACMSRNDSLELQLKAAKVLVNLASSDNDFTVQRLVEFPRLLEQLVNVLSKDNSPDLQTEVANCFGNLARTQYGKENIVAFPGAIQQLLASMSVNDNPRLQLAAGRALESSTRSENDITIRRLMKFPGVVEELVKLLFRDNTDDLQLVAVFSLRNLAERQVDEMRLTMMHCAGLLEKFFMPLSDEAFHQKSGWAYYVEALTHIDPARGNRAHLDSAAAYSRRGYANMILGQNEESLEDLNRANEMEPGDLSTLRARCTVKTRLEDFEGALVDSNSIIEKQWTGLDLQESGVLKRMMGDLQGALEDLNRSLELCPNDYEMLKQRAVVRFLMKDENGAHSDAQMALTVKPERVDASSYGRSCLGVSSVEFLDYKLR